MKIDNSKKAELILESNRMIQQILLTKSHNKIAQELSSLPGNDRPKPLLREISGGQVHLIKTLERMLFFYEDGVTLKMLCEELGITPASGSSMVDKLVKKGLLNRVQDNNDRRKVNLTFSKVLQNELHHTHTQMNAQAVDLILSLDNDLVDRWFRVMDEVSNSISLGNERTIKQGD